MTIRLMITILDNTIIERIGIFFEPGYKVVYRFDGLNNYSVRKNPRKLNLRTGERLLRFIQNNCGVFDHSGVISYIPNYEEEFKLGSKLDYQGCGSYVFRTNLDFRIIDSLIMPIATRNDLKRLYERQIYSI